MTFSKPFKSYGQQNLDKKQVYRGFWGKFDQTRNFPEIAGKRIRMYFDFDTDASEPVKVKMALVAGESGKCAGQHAGRGSTLEF